MSGNKDSQWSFGEEFFESRDWEPNKANLGTQWRSVASRVIRQYHEQSIKPASGKTED